jgi:radical SAM protein with 4Fe4S-binding SPASM domain
MFSQIMKEGNYKTNLVLGARRIVPMGNGREMIEQLLAPKELLNFYERVQMLNKQMLESDPGNNFSVVCGCENGIFNDHIEDKRFFSFGICGVLIKKIITVMPDGELYPCRRLPIALGNIKKISFQEVFEGNGYKKFAFGEDYKLSKECYFCSNVKNCLGGALCVTHAFSNGKALSPDPQCWKLFKSLDDSKDYVCNKKSFKKVLLKTLQIVKNNLN